MKSMTGYAYYEAHICNAEISLELKSYNSRFLDISLSLPPWMGQLEPFFRSFINRHIERGKVECSLRVKTLDAENAVEPNVPLAEAYCRSMTEIAEKLGMQDAVTLELVLKQEGVLRFQRHFDAALWENALPPVLESLFAMYDQGRLREGVALYTDITAMLEHLTDAVNEIERNVEDMERIFSDMLKKKCADIMEKDPDPQRLMQEIAILLVKYTINEEIIRAKAHIGALQYELDTNETPGRKIDFLCQEINREINTIGSKNQLPAIGKAVITAKNALENIREQARNIA